MVRLNCFPVAGGVSSTLSGRVIAEVYVWTQKRDCKMQFDPYAQVHLHEQGIDLKNCEELGTICLDSKNILVKN